MQIHGVVGCFTIFAILLQVSHCSTNETFSWDPSNLQAVVRDGANGYVSIEVSWEPGICGKVDNPLIRLIRDNMERNRSTSSSGGFVKFDNCEFWSTYDVVLESGTACFKTVLKTSVITGSGPPHQPKEIRIKTHDVFVEYSIVEAFMPRGINGYISQVCRKQDGKPDSCSAHTFIPHKAVDGLQNGTIKELQPDSLYSFVVTPVILYENDSLHGDSLSSIFRTDDSPHPNITNVLVEFEQRNTSLTASFTWELTRSKYPVVGFGAFLEPCVRNCSRDIEVPAATFDNVVFDGRIILRISVHVMIEGVLVQYSSSFKFTSPESIPPTQALEVAKLSPTKMMLHWNLNLPSSVFNVSWCRLNDCDHRLVSSSNILLANLQPASTYDVEIVIHKENFKSHYFKGDLQTLEKDYDTPTNVSSIPIANSSIGVAYKFHFWCASKPSYYELRACTEEDYCRQNRTNDVNGGLLELEYFTTYNLSVSAVYKLPLKQQVKKINFSPLKTVGRAPGPVTDLISRNITSNSFDLHWLPPKNLPEWVTIVYEVVVINATSQTKIVPRSSVHLENFKPFTNVTVEVRANVTRLGEVFTGPWVSLVVRTDVDKPGKPRNLVARQESYSSVVTLRWDPPIITNGRLDFYEVAYKPSASNETANILLVNGTQANITLPTLLRDTTFNFRVTPVNLNLIKKKLAGDAAEINFIVKGIDLTINVTLEGRTASSLQILITSLGEKGSRKPYFEVTDYKGRVQRTSLKLVTVNNLRTFTNETLLIRSCYTISFCTNITSFTALTNVGIASQVRDLSVKLVNRTNLKLEWKKPEVTNGPVDLYSIQLIDKSEPFEIKNFTVKSRTDCMFESTVEYETFEIRVTAGNIDLDKPTNIIFGVANSIGIKTSGFSVPKPENVTVVDVTATTVNLTWEKAADENGFKIKSFFVEVVDLKVPSFFTSNLSATISDLTPYKNFTIEVRSCTNSSTTKDCGQPRALKFATDSAAPSEPQGFQADILDEHTVKFSWQPPLTRNGKINGYSLKLVASAGNQTWLDTTKLTLTVTKMDPTFSYNASLSAFNFNEDFKRLDSPPVSLVNFSTGKRGLSTLAWILIFASASIVISAIAGAVYFYKQRLNNRYRTLEEI